jgi:hypothetical protein
MTPSPCGRTSSSAGTDQTFNLLMGRRSRPPTGARSSRSSRSRCWRHRRRAEDVQVAGQPDRDHRAARGHVRQDALDPRRGAGRAWYDLLLGEPVPERRRPARRQAGARACARDPLPRAGGGCPRPRRPSTRVRVARTAEDIEEATVPADGDVHLPELIATVFGGSRSEASPPPGLGRGQARRSAAGERGPGRPRERPRRPRAAGRQAPFPAHPRRLSQRAGTVLSSAPPQRTVRPRRRI